MDGFAASIGQRAVQRDVCSADRIARLAAMLDHELPPWRAGTLPPLGHWLCFLPGHRQSAMGEDGHQQRTGDGLLPDVRLPRRMWVGSHVRFLQDIPLGTRLIRTSTLTAATPKKGRSGAMLFVTLRHEIGREEGEIAIIEDQEIVYREAAVPGEVMERRAEPVGEIEPGARHIVADPTLLFRYSALTFNAHRIHYDRDYAHTVEGYPGLVVQGPLIATLLLDHLLRAEPAIRLNAYRFRATSPLFAGEAITLCLRRRRGQVDLRAIGPSGVAMHACAEFEEGDA